MFNMIVAVFAVVLLAALAFATIWWGGGIYTGQTLKAEASEVINAGSQIRGSLELYRPKQGHPMAAGEEGQFVNVLMGLDYLNSAPKGNWSYDGSMVQRPIDSIEICREINVQMGMNVDAVEDGCPVCDDTSFLEWSGCQIPGAVAEPT